MSNVILLIGESGSGKSHSLQYLNPNETFLINVLGKDMPFRGWKKMYLPANSKNNTGNMVITDDSVQILKTMKYVETIDKIKTIIIDDFNYVLTNEFVRRAKEKGYDKWNEIAEHGWKIIFEARLLRQDQTIIFIMHSQQDEFGKQRPKTVGKMLDDKICIEGMFTIVLQSAYEDGKYFFETQTNGQTVAKSPEKMFEDRRIENNMQKVIEATKKYEEG